MGGLWTMIVSLRQVPEFSMYHYQNSIADILLLHGIFVLVEFPFLNRHNPIRFHYLIQLMCRT